MSCGIKSIGLYLPPQVVTASQMSVKTGIPESILINKYGISKKREARKHETSYYMGVKAAENALNKTLVKAKDLDVIIWVGSQNNEKIMWITAISIAKDIGADNAWAFDINALCGSMLVGITIAQSLLDTHPEYNNVLLVGGCRDVDYLDESDANTHFLLDLSSGAASVLISKDNKENNILGASYKCDGSLSNVCYAIKDSGVINGNVNERIKFTMTEPDIFKSVLKESSLNNFEMVIKEALKKSNLQLNDIDYLAILHVKKSAHDEILNRIQVDSSKSLYLANYGHMEQFDPILSLCLAKSRGIIRSGSKVVMVSAGLGFIWGAIVIDYK
ncbi:TPA: 3-oxoacyl-ACP synthase [Klebsiella pneumoniae]